MNNEHGIDLKDFMIKIILVILFVFLLMWLFPMPNLKPVYDRIFVDNIETMKNVAKTYYTVERLPKNVGDKVSMTLEEMINQKFVLPIFDSEGNSCNPTGSFIEIIKTETEYVIKTMLSCPTRADYVIEHLGCYDICSDICLPTEKDEPKVEPQKLTEYKFSRDVYKGYKLVTGKVTEYEHVKYKEEVTGFDYKCANGTKQGTNCLVTFTTSYTTSADIRTSTSSYTIAAENKEVKTTYTVPAIQLNSTEQNEVPAKTRTVTNYTCKSGDQLGNKCLIKVQDGFTYGAWSNPVTQTSTTPLKEYQNNTEKRVHIGTEQQFACGTCFTMITVYKYNFYTRTATPKYKTEEVPADPIQKTEYYCTEGTLDGNKCIIINHVTRPFCISGTLKGNECERTKTETKPYCSIGTLEGDRCRITTGSSYYHCSVGVREGANCRITETRTRLEAAKKTPIYTKVLEDRIWSVEKKLVNWEATGKKQTRNLKDEKIYTSWVTKLPDGYTLYKRKEEHRWSNKTALPGWNKTSEKRETIID